MKLNLDRTYIHSGKRYGPGEADVPEGAAKDIQARMEATAAPAPRLDSTAAGQQHPADGGEKAADEAKADKPAAKKGKK